MSDEQDTPSNETTDDVTPAADGDVPAAVAADAELPAVSAEEAAEDRLFGLVAFGLMILLLICVVLILIADRRPPAGL